MRYLNQERICSARSSSLPENTLRTLMVLTCPKESLETFAFMPENLYIRNVTNRLYIYPED